jgi:hypothetical protein
MFSDMWVYMHACTYARIQACIHTSMQADYVPTRSPSFGLPMYQTRAGRKRHALTNEFAQVKKALPKGERPPMGRGMGGPPFGGPPMRGGPFLGMGPPGRGFGRGEALLSLRSTRCFQPCSVCCFSIRKRQMVSKTSNKTHSEAHFRSR